MAGSFPHTMVVPSVWRAHVDRGEDRVGRRFITKNAMSIMPEAPAAIHGKMALRAGSETMRAGPHAAPSVVRLPR